jgi:dynein heavy chain
VSEYVWVAEGGSYAANLDLKLTGPPPCLTPHPPTSPQPPGKDIHPLANLADSIALDGPVWRNWFELEAPEPAHPPAPLAGALSPFERLLLLRCLRVDRVTVGVTRWVMGELGERYVTPPVLDYASLYRASNEVTPVVFVLSPGADPAFDVFK